MKKRRLFVISSISVMAIIVVLIYCVINNAFLLPGKDSAETLLNRNEEDILIVVNYLVCNDNPFVYIATSDGYMYTGYTKKIEDQVVSESINRLLTKKGFRAITKSGNTISFLRWARLMDFGSGLAYSIDNEKEPTLPYLTKLESLSQNGWYYYEEDHNKQAS